MRIQPAIIFTAQKMKFFIKDFFSKCEQIRSLLRICSHLLKKSLMENFIFCTAFIARLQACFGDSYYINSILL